MKFDYGITGLEIDLHHSWNTTIIPAKKQKVIDNPKKIIKDNINHPLSSMSLADIIKQKKHINQACIVVSDATRPVPSSIILDALITELNSYGVNNEKILVLVATGLHHASNQEELKRIVGQKFIKKVKIINHNAYETDSLIFLDKDINGVPISINKHYYNSDVKILTGYVEPHFFFGFSGGTKSIVPGIAGADTIQANHSAENIASPYALFGIHKNNPMAINSGNIAKLIGCDFAINVCINEEHKITQVAAGDLEEVHKQLIDYQLKYIFKKIDSPYDIVICGNGGFPLDLNLYQAVKSMAIGEIAVKDGGTIISVNECKNGIGKGHQKFKQLLFSGMTPKIIYNKILNKEIVLPDQWEIQILTRVMMKAEIYLVSKLKEEDLGNIGLKYAKDVETAINLALKKHGKDARILVLPNGPQKIPRIKMN